MMEKMYFRLAARCEAAGRPNNEDNFQVDADLSVGKWQFQRDEVVTLGDKGALLLVCDGMGGMNAGEVASKIAVDTVKYRFSKDSLANVAIDSDEQRYEFIRRVIQEADANIKKESSADAAKRGMGSTIVLAWLLDRKVYVGWCGDSRAYKYNPKHGFVQLSHDHSYVQELVDSGKLSPELAFDHPNNNVITRSLGDPRGAAQPDVKHFPLEEDDVILLCSDGLCGVLRDHELEQLIASHQNSMASCCDALWEAARNAGWHDNVTIALAQIMSQQGKPQDAPSVEYKPIEKPIEKPKKKNKKYLKIGLAALAALLVVLALILVVKYLNKNSNDQEQGEGQPTLIEQCDQISPIVDTLCSKGFKLMDHTSILDRIENKIDIIKNCPEAVERLKTFCDETKVDSEMDEDGSVARKIENIKNKLQ